MNLVDQGDDTPKEYVTPSSPITPKDKTVHFLKKFLKYYSVREYHEKVATAPAIALGEFNGSKEDFITCLANITADKTLRDYGLLHLLPFYLHQLSELFESEDFHLVAELHIDHYSTHLIDIKNTNPEPLMLKDQVILVDIGEICEHFHRENYRSKVNKFKIEMKKSRQCVSDWWSRNRWIVLGMVGAVVATLTYHHHIPNFIDKKK